MVPKFKKNEIITCIMPNDSLTPNRKYKALYNSYVEDNVEYVTIIFPYEDGYYETRTHFAYRFTNLKNDRKLKLKKIDERGR